MLSVKYPIPIRKNHGGKVAERVNADAGAGVGAGRPLGAISLRSVWSHQTVGLSRIIG